MKASQLIERLQDIIEREGDIDVFVAEWDEFNKTFPKFKETFVPFIPRVFEKEEFEDNFLGCDYHESTEQYEQAPEKFLVLN